MFKPREKKYRAYTKERGIFYPPGIMSSSEALEFQDWSSAIINAVVTERTGLQDKDGVDIREGDVLEKRTEKREYKEITQHLVQRDEKGYDIPKDYKQYKVIGNIFQDKHLLNK